MKLFSKASQLLRRKTKKNEKSVAEGSMESQQDSSVSDPLVFEGEYGTKIPAAEVHHADEMAIELVGDDRVEVKNSWEKIGKDDGVSSFLGLQFQDSSSPVLEVEIGSESPEIETVSLYDSDDDREVSKIVLFDSDKLDDEDYSDDEYGYGPKIPPGYERIPAPRPGIENAYLRNYNHDLCCYDDEYDSERHLQKALYESILASSIKKVQPGFSNP